MKKKNLYLECILDDQEKLNYSKELGENISAKQRSEDALKSFSSQKKAEIAGTEAKINALADKINTGREFREVECVASYDLDARRKFWTRTDTGVIASNERMTDDEIEEQSQGALALDEQAT